MVWELIKSGAAVGATRAIGMGLGFALTIFLARQIGAAGVGIYGYVTAVLLLLGVFISNGCATMVLRATSRSLVDPAWGEVRGMVAWSVKLAGFVAVAAGAIAWVSSSLLPSWAVEGGAIPMLTTVLFLDQLAALRLSVLRGIGQPVWGQLPETLFRPLLVMGMFLAQIALLPEPPGILGAFLALLLASAGSLLIGTLVLRRKAPAALRTAVPTGDPAIWGKAAGRLAGSAVFILLNSQIDLLLLGLLANPADLGLYRVAVQIALLSGFVYSALNFVLMQRFSQLKVRDDLRAMARLSTNSARIAFASTLGLPLAFYFLGDDLISLTFGPAFVPALKPLAWLFAAQIFNAFFGFSRTLLVMNDHEQKILRLTIVGTVLNGLLCLILISAFGFIGAAAANCIANSLWNAVIWWRCLAIAGVDTSVIGLQQSSSRYAQTGRQDL